MRSPINDPQPEFLCIDPLIDNEKFFQLPPADSDDDSVVNQDAATGIRLITEWLASNGSNLDASKLNPLDQGSSTNRKQEKRCLSSLLGFKIKLYRLSIDYK